MQTTKGEAGGRQVQGHKCSRGTEGRCKAGGRQVQGQGCLSRREGRGKAGVRVGKRTVRGGGRGKATGKATGKSFEGEGPAN